jgi:hypothetical protein
VLAILAIGLIAPPLAFRSANAIAPCLFECYPFGGYINISAAGNNNLQFIDGGPNSVDASGSLLDAGTFNGSPVSAIAVALSSVPNGQFYAATSTMSRANSVATASWGDSMQVSGTCTINGNTNIFNLAPCIDFHWSVTGDVLASGDTSSTAFRSEASIEFMATGNAPSAGGNSGDILDGVCGGCTADLAVDHLSQNGDFTMTGIVSSGNLVSWDATLQVGGNSKYDPGCACQTSVSGDPEIVVINLDPTHLAFGPTSSSGAPPSLLSVSDSFNPATPAPGQTTTDNAKVTNNGATSLSGINSVDTLHGALACPSSTLAAGDSETCNAAFTAPAVGTYSNLVVASGLDPNGATVSGEALSTLQVSQQNQQPTLTTALLATNILQGSYVSDMASLAGATGDAGGTIAFFFSTSNNCPATGATQVGATVAVSGNGDYSSSSQTFSTPGTYYWYAVYSGDGSNNGASSPCEPLVVQPTTTGVPEFPAGVLVLIAATVPLLLLLRKRVVAAPKDF